MAAIPMKLEHVPCVSHAFTCRQVSYLSALIDLDGDRLITAEEILEAFKQVLDVMGWKG
jgi:hypothetical protein